MSERNIDQDMDALAQEGISCRVEGDHVVCTGEKLEVAKKSIQLAKIDFNAPAVRKLFEDQV